MNAVLNDRRGKVLVNTGLSSTVVGCVVKLERDPRTMQAKVVVLGSVPADPIKQAAVKQTAKALANRASRFLGINWTVSPWDGSYDD